MKRRGRKRNLVARQPNGQPYRPPVDERETALKARERVFGVSATVAASMPETSFLGRLRAEGMAFERASKVDGAKDAYTGITQRQFDAASEYQRIRREYDRLHPIRGYPQPGDLDRGGGYDDSDGTDPSYVASFKKVRDLESACWQALFDAAKVDHRVPSTVENVVILGHSQPHMIGPLRMGLNALAVALDIPNQQQLKQAS